MLLRDERACADAVSSANRRRRLFDPVLLFPFLLGLASAMEGTTIAAISDIELSRRADVIVYGAVVKNEVIESSRGLPETVTWIRPSEVLKGRSSELLVLRQLGGRLRDGRGLDLAGRPEYIVGREVVVFAIERSDGDFQTAELALGKFEVWQDENGGRFAVPEISRNPEGVRILGSSSGDSAPRELRGFLRFLRSAGRLRPRVYVEPSLPLVPVVSSTESGSRPAWMRLSPPTRWNNGATAEWWTTVSDAAALGAVDHAIQAWKNVPSANISYSRRLPPSEEPPADASIAYLDVTSSDCGWNTCMASGSGGGGVVGCGWSETDGEHLWRGGTYRTSVRGRVQIRCRTTPEALSADQLKSLLGHEFGHTLGLDHPRQCLSGDPGDPCVGDEADAIMKGIGPLVRIVPNTDDEDGIRWLYGDGETSCGRPGGAFSGTRLMTPCWIE